MNTLFVRIPSAVAVLGLVMQFTSVGRADFMFDEPSRFPAPINSSSFWDSTPVLSPNNLELYFTSNRSGWGTYLSTRDTPSDSFGTPAMVTSIMGHASISSDGLSIYGNHDPGPYGAADIYTTSRQGVDDPWGSPSVLDSSINTGQWERWASISPDGRELYFTRTTAYDTSVADIWVARRADPSALFEPAVKLPANINKEYTSAPSLSPNGLSLFFTSNGHGGYGNSDIFVSYREDRHSPWEDPVNLGPTINGAGFEWQPSMSADGRTFLFSRSPRVGSGSDLWWAHVFAPGDHFTTAQWPSTIYTLSDTDNGSAFDNLGDSANSKMWSPAAAIGERDTSDGNAIVRLVTKFALPQMPNVARRLERATLRLFLEDTAGTPAGPVSLLHSVDDNDLEELPSDYEDGSYADSLLDLVHPTDMGQQYYELDVTDLVLADYAADGEDPLSAFRLQVNDAVFTEDDQSHRYRFTMLGAADNHPELVLTFIPEPSTLILCIIALGVVGGWRKWERRGDMSGCPVVMGCLLGLLLTAVSVAPAGGQILVDDFSDGNDNGWTHVDTGEGYAWGPGIFDASSGAYNLQTTGLVPDNGLGFVSSFWDASADPFYNDGVWRTTVRAESGGTNVSLLLRGEPVPDGAGWLVTTTIFGELELWDCDEGNCQYRAGRNVGFARGEDWIIEAGAVGDLITAKMWRVGGPMPDEPQVSRRSTKHPTGQFGVASYIGTNWNAPAQVSAFFDDIYFTAPMPEPLLGDVNLDGEVNGLDVDPFVEVLLSGPYQPEADMNVDQVVNGLDVDPFVAAVVGGAQSIPEPSTLLLCIVALGLIGGWRRWSG